MLSFCNIYACPHKVFVLRLFQNFDIFLGHNFVHCLGQRISLCQNNKIVPNEINFTKLRSTKLFNIPRKSLKLIICSLMKTPNDWALHTLLIFTSFILFISFEYVCSIYFLLCIHFILVHVILNFV